MRHIQRTTLLLFLFSASVYAIPGHIYIGGAIESATVNVGQTNPQLTYNNDTLTDNYPINDSNNTKAVISLNGGYEFNGEGKTPAIAVGIGAYTTPNAYHFNGQVNETPLGDPTFLLYQYQYNIKNTRLMLETQFTWQIRQFAPFINVGIGPSWNQFSGYSETVATPDGYVSLPPFSSETATQFAYQIGVGIGYLFNFTQNNACGFQHERVSLGYRYANLGNLSSGIRNEDYPFKLELGSLRTNSIYLAYTHLF